MKKLTKETFAARVKELNPNVELIGEYRSSGKRIKVRCKQCRHQWKPIAGSLHNGHDGPERAGAGANNTKNFDKR